ncbi:MAG: class I SAM-dependent methyltransferase [Chthoniobacterales bacterium]
MSAIDITTDLPSAGFRPRVYGVGAWTNHLHFAYDLIAALRPRLLVELGTDRGESYFAFCQSAHENGTETRCFAVDSFLGDAQAGDYDETTFGEVSAHNARYYPAFSTVVRAEFDAAAHQFGTGTIDLLHLDGLHTETAVRHDLETWLPKLRPGGILLLHDVDVRQQHFGVGVVWTELTSRGRSFTFHLGPGLGVWEKPPARRQPGFVEALFATDSKAAKSLVEYYEHAARQLHAEIARQWQDGSIRDTAFAGQTIIQLFHSNDATHSEQNSVLARVGHGDWKTVTLTLPSGAGAAPLRLDFVSALTTIELQWIRVSAGEALLFSAAAPAEFDQLTIAGDCEREPHRESLQLRITGIDPQLYLPAIETKSATPPLAIALRLRVSAGTESNRSVGDSSVERLSASSDERAGSGALSEQAT